MVGGVDLQEGFWNTLWLGTGWFLLLAGSCSPSPEVATCHVSCATGDDLLQKFWKMLRCLNLQISHSTFQGQPGRRWQIHCSSAQKRECQTIRRIKDPSSTSPLSVICTQRTSSKTLPRLWKNTSSLDTQLGHAEAVSQQDLEKPPHEVFYLPVRKDSSTTTNASMKRHFSLNDSLMVVHPSVIEVLIRFRMHRIADISKMYRAIELPWRSSPDATLQDDKSDIWRIFCSEHGS